GGYMNWDLTIEAMLNGEEVSYSWEQLVKKANTEERVADLVAVLDAELSNRKQTLIAELEDGADISQIEKLLDEAEQAYRVTRSEFDILYFGYEYFSEDRNEGNESNAIPAGVDITDAPRIHQELCFELHTISN